MGYRTRLGKIAKSEKARYAGLGPEEVDRLLGECEACYRLNAHTQLYEIGKYFDIDTPMTDFFDFNVENEYECEFSILPKEGLREIICLYHKNTHKFFAELACHQKSGDMTDLDIVQNHLNSMVRAWDPRRLDHGVAPYYLDEANDSDGFIAKSWDMQYAIFNLVYIYRTFDWENDYLIYSGW